ncbi:MAG: division/cell wall cluster transcriptional repressor MraZ [Myxococcota bacterium]
MFFGSHEHVLDDKGRTSLPKDFRQLLKQQKADPWLTAGAHCLAIYTADEFDRIKAKLTENALPDGEIIRQQRRILGNATRCRVDAQGRILVPQTLRRYARLQRDIVFAGLGTLIEVWDRSLWKAEMDRARAESE